MFWNFFFIILPFIVQLLQKHLSPLEIRTIIKIGIQKEFLWTVRGLCRKPLFRLWSFVWGLWLCCGQTHAFAEHLCRSEHQELAKAFSAYRGASPTPTVSGDQSAAHVTLGGGCHIVHMRSFSSKAPARAEHFKVRLWSLQPGLSETRVQVRTQHRGEEGGRGRQKEGKGKEGRRECVWTAKKRGFLYLFKSALKEEARRMLFPTLAPRLHGLVCQLCHLLAQLSWDPWSSVLSSVRWEGRFLLDRVVLKDKWENI